MLFFAVDIVAYCRVFAPFHLARAITMGVTQGVWPVSGPLDAVNTLAGVLVAE